MSRIRTILLVLLGLFLVNLLVGPRADAQTRSGGGGGSGFGLSQRAEKRESTRWTLQEWLDQRDRGRMMDLWLSMNSPSPFEVMFGGSYLATKTSIDNPVSEDSFEAYAGELRMYAQFVGLTAEYANHTQEKFTDLSGMLNLRLFGNSLQNSSLTLSFGQRSRTVEISGQKELLRNVFSQAELQLYLARYFGLDAHYRYFEPVQNDAIGGTVGGSETEAGLFIDFKAVRVFGAWYQDKQVNKTDTSETNILRQGIKSGLRIYY